MQPNEVVTNTVLDSPHDEEEDVDASVILKKLRLSNKNSLLIAHLNINSIRNKLEALKCLISKNIDILITAMKGSFRKLKCLISKNIDPL